MKSFRIKNIKSFADSKEIDIKPITIFVGRNSCGKSSLIRFPAVLAQTANAESDSPIKFYGKMVDYGNYEDVIHYGATEKMSFDLKYTINVSITNNRHSIDYFLKTIMGEKIDEEKKKDFRDIILRITLDKPEKRLSVEKLELYLEDKCLYFICRTDNQKYTFYVNYIYENGEFIEKPYYMDIDRVGFEKFVPRYDFTDALRSIYNVTFESKISEEKIEELSKIIGMKNESEDGLSDDDMKILSIWKQFEYYSDLTRDFFRKYTNEAHNIRYIGPFRADPERIYRDPEYNSYGVGVHGEHTSNELIRDFRRKDAKLIANISKWTKEILGCEIVLKEVTTGMFQIMLKNAKGVETNLIDNGYGISQVLPIVTEVVRLTAASFDKEYAMEIDDKMLILEQPELHLHPAAQSELADLFVNCILTSEGKKKILIETHSEHLIRKLQVLIASKECGLTNEMVRIYYVDKDDNGEAFVEEMKILENGKFETAWPSGFFDKGYLLSRELARAGIQD